MREIVRVKMGFFPTQDRIVHAIAKLFKTLINQSAVVVAVDAGSGNAHQ